MYSDLKIFWELTITIYLSLHLSFKIVLLTTELRNIKNPSKYHVRIIYCIGFIKLYFGYVEKFHENYPCFTALKYLFTLKFHVNSLCFTGLELILCPLLQYNIFTHQNVCMG